MLSWGAKRQLIIGSVATLIVVALISVPVYKKFFDKIPTCFDGIQDGDEAGVDCGGTCSKVCAFQAKLPLVSYTRIYEVSPGRYNVLAMVENLNQGVFASSTEYSFKVYDNNNVLLAEKDGNTVIPPGEIFPVFDYGIETGDRVPQSVSFAMQSNINWESGSFPQPNLSVNNKGWSATGTAPVLEADITNQEVYPVSNIKAVVLVYDSNENVIAASQSLIDSILPQGTKSVFFVWNTPFSVSPSKTQIFLIPSV